MEKTSKLRTHKFQWHHDLYINSIYLCTRANFKANFHYLDPLFFRWFIRYTFQMVTLASVDFIVTLKTKFDFDDDGNEDKLATSNENNISLFIFSSTIIFTFSPLLLSSFSPFIPIYHHIIFISLSRA